MGLQACAISPSDVLIFYEIHTYSVQILVQTKICTEYVPSKGDVVQDSGVLGSNRMLYITDCHTIIKVNS